MKTIFHQSRTTFEKIFFSVIVLYLVITIIGCNVNLDMIVYASFGSYVILGLLSFLRPKMMMDVLKKEDEEFLVRNQKLIPSLKKGFRWGGLFLIVTGVLLNYIFIVYY